MRHISDASGWILPRTRESISEADAAHSERMRVLGKIELTFFQGATYFPVVSQTSQKICHERAYLVMAMIFIFGFAKKYLHENNLSHFEYQWKKNIRTDFLTNYDFLTKRSQKSKFYFSQNDH